MGFYELFCDFLGGLCGVVIACCEACDECALEEDLELVCELVRVVQAGGAGEVGEFFFGVREVFSSCGVDGVGG